VNELLGKIVSLNTNQFVGIWFAWICAVCIGVMVVFERCFSPYLPRPRFRAPLVVQLTTVAAMGCGLMGLTVGVLHLYGTPLAGFERPAGLQLIILVGGGFLLVVAGWRVWKGGTLAGIIVTAIPLLDIAWNMIERQGGGPGAAPTRLLIGGLVAALGIVCMVAIPRRWKALRYQEIKGKRIRPGR